MEGVCSQGGVNVCASLCSVFNMLICIGRGLCAFMLGWPALCIACGFCERQ